MTYNWVNLRLLTPSPQSRTAAGGAHRVGQVGAVPPEGQRTGEGAGHRSRGAGAQPRTQASTTWPVATAHRTHTVMPRVGANGLGITRPSQTSLQTGAGVCWGALSFSGNRLSWWGVY